MKCPYVSLFVLHPTTFASSLEEFNSHSSFTGFLVAWVFAFGLFELLVVSIIVIAITIHHYHHLLYIISIIVLVRQELWAPDIFSGEFWFWRPKRFTPVALYFERQIVIYNSLLHFIHGHTICFIFRCCDSTIFKFMFSSTIDSTLHVLHSISIKIMGSLWIWSETSTCQLPSIKSGNLLQIWFTVHLGTGGTELSPDLRHTLLEGHSDLVTIESGEVLQVGGSELGHPIWKAFYWKNAWKI